jgi:hypothetical protein
MMTREVKRERMTTETEGSPIGFKDLPNEVNEALTLLWNYADDGCFSSRTKQECDDEGYECIADSAYYITFVISHRKENK